MLLYIQKTFYTVIHLHSIGIHSIDCAYCTPSVKVHQSQPPKVWWRWFLGAMIDQRPTFQGRFWVGWWAMDLEKQALPALESFSFLSGSLHLRVEGQEIWVREDFGSIKKVDPEMPLKHAKRQLEDHLDYFFVGVFRGVRYLGENVWR